VGSSWHTQLRGKGSHCCAGTHVRAITLPATLLPPQRPKFAVTLASIPSLLFCWDLSRELTTDTARHAAKSSVLRTSVWYTPAAPLSSAQRLPGCQAERRHFLLSGRAAPLFGASRRAEGWREGDRLHLSGEKTATASCPQPVGFFSVA